MNKADVYLLLVAGSFSLFAFSFFVNYFPSVNRRVSASLSSPSQNSGSGRGLIGSENNQLVFSGNLLIKGNVEINQGKRVAGGIVCDQVIACGHKPDGQGNAIFKNYSDACSVSDDSANLLGDVGQTCEEQLLTNTFAWGNTSQRTVKTFTVNGPNQLLMVGVSMNNHRNDAHRVKFIKYGGITLAKTGVIPNINGDPGDANDDARIEIHSLTNPPVGANQLEVEFEKYDGGWANQAPRASIIGAVTFAQVNLANPLGVFTAAKSNSGQASINMPSAPGNLIFAVVDCEECSQLNPTSGQIEKWEIKLFPGDPGKETTGAGRVLTATSSNTKVSWKLQSPDYWAIGGVAIKFNP